MLHPSLQSRASRWLTVSGIAALLFLCAGAGSSAQSPAPTVIRIDGHGTGRVFQGIGAVSAGASSRLLVDYPEPWRSQILDYLFRPNYGAALQHLKVEIGADVNSTDGAEPSSMRSRDDHNYTRGYEWWLMQEARKRNPHIILDTLPWGAPGWVGDHHFFSQDMADYVADFLRGAKTTYGLDIAYTGEWNETRPDYGYARTLAATLRRNGLTTRLVRCDLYPNSDEWEMVKASRSDPVLAQDIAAFTVHYPFVKGKYTTTEAARQSGKPLWSSEDQPGHAAGNIQDRGWQVGGRSLARIYNLNYIQGGFTKTEIWSPVTSYYDILAAPHSGLMYANTPWSGSYRVQGAIWATAHTTQFAQPGWQYVDEGCGLLPGHGSYVTLKSPNHRDWSVIVETISATQPAWVRLRVSGDLSEGTVHIWETNHTKRFAHVQDATFRNHELTLRLDPDSLYSITTTLGQGKGTATPPPNTPFPLPFHVDLEHTAWGRSPRFLADQDGAFEVHPCHDAAGRCLEQVITDRPTPWGPEPDPWTLAGDEQWTGYTLSADARFLPSGDVTLMGRIDSADVFADKKAKYPSGYIFRLQSNGNWQLINTRYSNPPQTLAWGTVSVDPAQWQHLALRFSGSDIAVLLDGRQLAHVRDSTHPHGMIGIGSSWNHIQFRQITVSPSAGQ